MMAILKSLLGGLGFKNILYIILGLTLVGGIIYGVVETKKFFKHVGEQDQRIAELSASLNDVGKTFARYREDLRDIRSQVDKQVIVQKEAVASEKELFKKLHKESEGKHTLEQMADKHPKMIQKAVNKGTSKALSCVEALSGKEGATCGK